MSKISKEVRIGLVSVVALFIVYFGINFLKGINIFKPSNSYTAKFDNVSDMLVADPITVNGLKIGQVFGMELDPDNPKKVLVSIQMEKGIKIPKGSTLSLNAGMLGGSTLILDRNLNSKQYLEVGDTLTGKRSAGMVDMLSAVVPKAEGLLPKIDSILGGVEKLVNNPELQNAMTKTIPSIMSEFEKTNRDINNIVAQLNKELPQMVQNLSATVENFEQISGQVSQIDMLSTFNKLDSTMANLQALSARINSKEGTIGLLLNDRQLYDSLNMTIQNASLLLEDVRKNPSKYINVKVF